MEQQGLTLDDLAPLLGGQARAEDVLAGRRDLTVPMIRALRDHLGIPADVLIGHGPASAA
jgi:HTH-type transcriptional regulator/antitoxin HigA